MASFLTEGLTGYGLSGDLMFEDVPQIWREIAPRSIHRESKETIAYLPTTFMLETGLTPSILHCEMDALAVSSYLLRVQAPDVRIMEIRKGSKGALVHERAIWLEDGANFYDYGIHYVAVSGASVFDLQSLIGHSMEVGAYLATSFPDQMVTTKLYWPNDFRGELRHSRDFLHARYNGFRDFPELTHDPLEVRPPVKTLAEIMKAARERRANSVA